MYSKCMYIDYKSSKKYLYVDLNVLWITLRSAIWYLSKEIHDAINKHNFPYIFGSTIGLI